MRRKLNKDPVFYVYAHKAPRTGAIFYIGKGVDKRAWLTSGRSAEWRSTVAAHGFDVEVIASGLYEADTLELERFLIAEFRSSGLPILNKSAGGQGASGIIHSEKTIALFRAAKLGKKQSPEHAAKSARSRLGHKNSPEAIEKTMQARRRPVKSSDGKTYASSRDAARAMQEKHGGGFSQGNISSAVSGKRKTAYGLTWSYAKE